MITSDGMHKMGRIILASISVITIGVVISINPDIDIEKIIASIAPVLSYILVKGPGNSA